MISRAKLRGKLLDADCKKAMRTSHEYGLQDTRVEIATTDEKTGVYIVMSKEVERK